MPIQVEAVFQEGVFRPLTPVELAEGQKVALEVEPLGGDEPVPKLPEWCNFMEGLTEEEIQEIEVIILDRSNFMRPYREDNDGVDDP
jgi:predicted DNA-binding antitoxin AbrB/MazE fold protein